MIFFTQFSKFNPKIEKDFPETSTEQVGYRSTEQIVKSYLNAGEALHAFRHSELYDYPDTSKDVDYFPDLEDIDPTRSLDFDEIDAVQAIRSLNEKIKDDLSSNEKKDKSDLVSNEKSNIAKQEEIEEKGN